MMKSKPENFRLIVVFLMLIISYGCADAQVANQKTENKQPEKSPDLSRFFENIEGTIVLYDVKNNRYLRHNEKRSTVRYTPASIFKIPNALIGLETGAVKDADSLIAWDKVKYPEQDWTDAPFVYWKQDHTLRSSMKYSVVWYYRELAIRIGEERMKNYLAKFEFGNQDISGGLASKRMFEGFLAQQQLENLG